MQHVGCHSVMPENYQLMAASGTCTLALDAAAPTREPLGCCLLSKMHYLSM